MPYLNHINRITAIVNVNESHHKEMCHITCKPDTTVPYLNHINRITPIVIHAIKKCMRLRCGKSCTHQSYCQLPPISVCVCMYVYLCICICIYTHICICIYTCTSTVVNPARMSPIASSRLCVCVYICIHMSVYVNVHTYIYTFIYIYIYIYVYIYVCIYIYIYIYMWLHRGESCTH